MKVSYLWLIPFFPMISALVIRTLGKRYLGRSAVHLMACVSVAISFALTLRAFASLTSLDHGHRELIDSVFPWIRVGTFEVWIRFLFDSLSCVMALVVTGVGLLIHIFSTGYMAHEEDYERYFAYLNFFMSMMLILILGDSLLLMFVGWEGVGLCSYLLIGFWFKSNENANAGKKAFVVNRVGDFGFMLGILTLFWVLGVERGIWNVDFATLRTHADVFTTATIFGMSAITFATLMLFVGATGKSAQIPLFVWLPDAMAGPTPVSALIHAATMVTAGVYMIARLSFLFDLAPVTLSVIACVGAATALFAASIGLVQNDIKKVLAYSTVSQLGYMFLACGVGAYGAGVFHLVTHAFFKGLLFLGAGSVIHAMGGEQDMRKMGGLRNKISWTHATFLIATLAIAGIPPFAGFFSKDEILWQAFSGPHGHPIFWILGVIAAGMTAFYMFRLYFMTFSGECRASEEVKHHVHESPPSMLIPLCILAFLSAVGGWLWTPGFFHMTQLFPHWLETAVVVHEHAANHTLEIILALGSLSVASAGIFLAHRLYAKPSEFPGRLAIRLANRFAVPYRVLLHKYFVDEIYEVIFVRGTKRLSAALYWFDSRIVDGLVNFSGLFVRSWAFIQGTLDRWIVDGLVNGMGSATLAIGRSARRMQSGRIQTYFGTLAGTFVVLAVIWLSIMVGS